MSDGEEPWSSYRALNAGLQRLANVLAEAQNTTSPAAFIPDAHVLALELARQAKTVETAAMARALYFFKYAALLPLYGLGSSDPGFPMLEKITAELNALIDSVESR